MDPRYSPTWFWSRKGGYRREDKAHKDNSLAWPRSKTSCKMKIRRKKSSWVRTRLGFYLRTLYIVDLENNPETQLSHIKG
jgi:hypothetical protein